MDLTTPVCPKCEGEMQRGFIPDYAYLHLRPSGWVGGSPRRSFWYGIKVPRGAIPIVTFRCMRCGYLESYAWRS